MDKNKAKINKVSAISYGMKKFLLILPLLLISPFLFPSHASAVSCAVSRYWVGGTGTWTSSDTTHWSATSGGAGGASVPSNGLMAIVQFDSNSGGGTVTLGYSPILGSCTSVSMGAFTGTFDASTFSPSFRTFSASGSGIRTLNMGSGTWTILSGVTCPNSPWNISDPTNLTLNAQTSTIKITTNCNSGPGTNFLGGNQTYNNVWFDHGASTGSVATVSGSNTFNDFKDTGTAAHTLSFTAGTTQTFSTFTVSGTAGNVVTINSSDNATTHALVKTGGGIISSDYLNIQHSVATPATNWYAGTHSTDNQAVATAGSGWIFTAPPPDYTLKGFFRFLRGVFRFK